MVTSKSHNIPYGEKFSDKNTNSSKNIKYNKKLLDFVNIYTINNNIHNDNYKIIEIYIKNQIAKITKLLKNNNKNKRKTNNDINNLNNYNNDVDKYQNLYKIDDKNNINININESYLRQFNNFPKEVNDISFNVLNNDSCQTIKDKVKNFCVKFFDNGSIYIGEIKDNKCFGHGKYITTKGDITMGYFKDNFVQGYEIIKTNNNNSVFEGQFEKNNFNGYGIEIFEDGSTYFGQFENNKKAGIGTYDWGDGCQYQGEWKNGLPHGSGIFNDNKNRLYEGEWKYGKMNGIGLFKWGDVRKYIGYYREDKRNGFGIFFWPNPLKIYLGFWVNGLPNGIGKIYTSFKEKYYLWEDGKVIKKILNKNDFNLQIEKNEIELVKKYSFYFNMSLDDLLTLILDL